MSRTAIAAVLISLAAAAGCTPRQEPAPYAPPVAPQPSYPGKV